MVSERMKNFSDMLDIEARGALIEASIRLGRIGLLTELIKESLLENESEPSGTVSIEWLEYLLAEEIASKE